MPIARGSGIHQRCGGTGFHRIAFNFNEAMKPLLASNSLPAWQTERVEKLHRACLSVQSAVNRGEYVSRAIYHVSRRLNGRPYKCDPSRRMALANSTMRAIWDTWRKDGMVPAALRLNYYSGNRIIYAPLLIRFLNFCAEWHWKTYKAAWAAFCVCENQKLSYGTLLRYLPEKCFKEFRRRHKSICRAQLEISRLRERYIAEIRERLPDRPPCRFRNRESDVQ